MHNHDHDLISALAEGILAVELATAAAVEIAACEVCSAELAGQQTSLEALRSAAPVAMTAVEASTLREAVAASLGVAEAPAPIPSQRSRRSTWTAIAIAAGLAGVITIVPVIGFIMPGSDDAGTATTMAIVALEGSPDDSGDERDTFGESATEDMEMAATAPVGADASTTQAAETTGAPATTMASLEEAASPSFNDASADGTEAIVSLFDSGPDDWYRAEGQQIDRASLPCSGAAEQVFGNEYLYIEVPASLDDGSPVALYAAADWSSLVAFDLDDCSVVLMLP